MSAADDLIERFMAVFGEPKSSDVDKFLDEYARALRGLDARVLEKAGDAIIKRSTFWPRPAEVYAEAEKVAAALYSTRAPDVPKYRKEPTPEEKARVREMLKDFFAHQVTVSEKPSKEPKGWVDGSRSAFEKMQRESPNQGLHRILTPTTKRMTGERDE